MAQSQSVNLAICYINDDAAEWIDTLQTVTLRLEVISSSPHPDLNTLWFCEQAKKSYSLFFDILSSLISMSSFGIWGLQWKLRAKPEGAALFMRRPSARCLHWQIAYISPLLDSKASKIPTSFQFRPSPVITYLELYIKWFSLNTIINNIDIIATWMPDAVRNRMCIFFFDECIQNGLWSYWVCM